MTPNVWNYSSRVGFAPRRARRGVMLLIVTLALTALALSGAALLALMRTENEATSTRGRESLVQGVDRSAVVFLIGALDSTQEERDKFGGLYDNPRYFCGAKLLTTEEGGVDSSHFTILSPKLLDVAIEGLRYGLVDESSRLNLDAVLAWDRESPGAGRRALMQLPGMTAVAADSILDWIDPDENPRQNGAEAAYYADKKLPYSPRNSAPVVLEELLLARGVTRSQLYGTDESFTYGADKAPRARDANANATGGSLGMIGALGGGESAQNSAARVPWKELITAFSAEKDVDPTGQARVDLNGDNLAFLYSELAERVGEDVAKFAILYRQYGDEVAQTPPTTTRSGRRSGYAGRAAAPGANAASNAASNATTTGTLAQATLDFSVAPTKKLATPLDLVGATATVDGTQYASPISDSRNADNIEKLFKLLDFASTSASTVIVGRVNVNVAPRAVLSAIPGLESADVERVIATRPDPAKPLPKDFRHASWLYAKGIVDLARMKSLYNKTTGRGDAYRGQIVGFLENSDEISRVEVVVDGTTVPPRQVFYKDLSSLGRGFSDAELIGGAVDANAATSANDDENPFAATTNLMDIETRESGYVGDASGADPFAAVESATGVAATAPALPSLAPPAPAPALETAATDATLPNATLPDATTTDSLSPSANGSTTPSRSERLLQTLQEARESRRARNQSALASGGANEATNANAAEGNARPDAAESATPRANPTPTPSAANATAPAQTQATGDNREDSDEATRERARDALRAARRPRSE